MEESDLDKPFPHPMIRITLYATRLSDLRQQISSMQNLNFHPQGNMEILADKRVPDKTGVLQVQYAYLQHMTRKP